MCLYESDALAENRLRTILLSFFAATALSLACIGLYGTLSYCVNVRQREVGLRLASGVLRGQIVQQFLWQGLVVCLFGCATGFALAAASSHVLAGLLYGVSPTDIPTLSGVVLLVLVVAAALRSFPPYEHPALNSCKSSATSRRKRGCNGTAKTLL